MEWQGYCNAIMILRVENLVFFSDAVFAFSITLMALSIQIPHISANISEGLLTKSLQGLLPGFSQYVFSFIVPAIYWNRYHRIFNYITHTDINRSKFSFLTISHLLLLLSLSITIIDRRNSFFKCYGHNRTNLMFYMVVRSK